MDGSRGQQRIALTILIVFSLVFSPIIGVIGVASASHDDVTIDVKYNSGERLEEVNALVVWQEGKSDPIRIIENYPGVSLPRDILNLPQDHEYRVNAYSNDQYVGSTGWFTLDEGTITIRSPSQGTIEPTVYYEDGTTPLEDATVRISTHENNPDYVWRSAATDRDGHPETPQGKFWLQPSDGQYDGWYWVNVTHDGNVVGSKRVDDLAAGGNKQISVTTSVELIEAEVTGFTVDGGTYSEGEVVEATATVKNTGTATHEFFVGYSVQGPDGEWRDNDGSTGKLVTLDPGETKDVDLSWTVETDASGGDYDAVTAVWKESNSDNLENKLDEQQKNDAFSVEKCRPRIETSPSTVDMGEFSAEDRPTVRIDVENTGCGSLNWDVSSTPLFTVVDRGDDYLTVRTADGVFGEFNSYVEVVALNDEVADDGFARTDLSGIAKVEASPPTAEFISPTGTTSYIGQEIDLRGGASPGSAGIPAEDFPAANADELVFIWEVDGTEIARSETDGSGGVPAVDTISHEFNDSGQHTVTLTVKDPLSGKTDTISQNGYSIEPATLTGTVSHAQVGDSLGGITVQIGDQSTTTSSSGSFSFTIHEAGTHTLRIDEAGYQEIQKQIEVDSPTGGSVVSDIELAGEPVDIGFTVQKQGSIEAFDWFGGQPLPDATVRLDGVTRDVDEHGRVLFEAVTPGVHTYNITAPGWGWNNGTQVVYGPEKNLEISAGLAPSGSGVLEIRPKKAGEPVSITKFNVYVDDRQMEPNIENNQLVLVEGQHTLRLVPTEPNEGLRTVRKEVSIERDHRTVVDLDVTLRQDQVLEDFENASGSTTARTLVEAGEVHISNSSFVDLEDGRTSLDLQVVAFGTPFANGASSGQTRVADQWTAPSDESVRVRAVYRLDGHIEARQASNQHPWPTTYQYAVAASSVTTRLVVIDITSNEVVVNDIDTAAYGGTPANDEEFLTDMGLKVLELLYHALSPLASKGASFLSSTFPQAGSIVVEGAAAVFDEAVGYIAGRAAEAGASAVFDTSGDVNQSISPARERVLTGAFEAEKGHKYAIVFFTDSEVAAAGVSIGGAGMAEAHVVSDLDRFVLERGENVRVPEDTTPPSVEITDKPAPAVRNGDVSITIHGSDDQSRTSHVQYSYRIIPNDGSASGWTAWENVSADGTATESFSLDPGVYTIEFRARDATGNVQYRTAKVPLTVDQTAPRIEITSRNVTETGATLAVTHINETAAHIEFDYRVEGATEWSDLAQLTRTNETRLQRSGTYEVRARAVDAAGNDGPWTRLTVTVPGSNVPPEVTASASRNDIQPDAEVTLQAEVTDDDDKIDELQIRWSLESGPTDVSIPDEMTPEIVLSNKGTYMFEVLVEDNDGAVATATVTVSVSATTETETQAPSSTQTQTETKNSAPTQTQTKTKSSTPTITPSETTNAASTQTQTESRTSVPPPTNTPEQSPQPAGTTEQSDGIEDQLTEAEEQAEELLTEAPGQPGFGIKIAIIALLVLTILIRRL